MVADQRRRRLNGSSIVGCSSLDQYRMKKRKLESPQNGLSSNSHISLVWDGNQKKVVAKKEQIGISRRNLRPILDSVSNSRSILADVFSIPRETFELEDLTEVLSYEVWQNQLSEDERTFLMQFLPRGQNAEQAVQSLLAGNNFHFGNPFLKWGDSLCSGNLHPDAVHSQERSLKAAKKAYYLDLQKYHNGMIDFLQKLKEKCEICKDPEKEILQKIWRSRRDADKRSSSNANESGLRDLEQDVTATSESCSWNADEKACSSDNQNSSVMRDGKLKKRMKDKGFMKDKSRIPLIASDDVLNVGTKPKKGDMLNKRNIHPNDGAKYMSYFKISKKQHELVKSMKHSGKSIQSRSLNSVLGNLDTLHVQPYEVFVEEERKKLHDHWLQLANEDLPTFYANWKERKSQLLELTKSLGQEMKSKLKSSMEDKEKENPGVQDEEKENPGVQDEEKENVGVQNEERENLGVQDEGKENSDSASQDENDHAATNHESNVTDEDESLPASQNQSPQQITSNSSHESDLSDMEPENNHVTAKSDVSSDVSEHLGKINTANDTVCQEVPLSSGRNVWPSVSRPYSYYDSTANHEFSNGDLPLAHPQVNQNQQTHLIDLESDMHEEDMRRDLLHRQPDEGSLSYPNQGRNELLQSLFKGQGISAYHHEQKPTGLNFHAPNNVLMTDGGQFSGHFQEQLGTSLPLVQGQKRLNEVFINQNISENIYTDRGRYLIPRHTNLQPANMQLANMPNWALNPVRLSEPPQSHLNGGNLSSQNWFSGEQQVRGGWTGPNGVNIPSQNIGNGSNADQSLFNVLSNCNQLRSVSPYDSIGPTEQQFISPRNYGLVAGGAPGINPALPHTGHPLDYFGGRDAAAASMIPDDISWVNLPHQNPSLHDPMGKPYLRSWNQ
ncbi:hypothetical protein LWI28_005692 [Acer negundo]|uniref:DEUBAD domain-containing protein n=1 Tax=Acer negundo TaxID=4023 RepID=A0AAD5NPV1_ACENE|nr:hypothetical protein LWI28_005692 [Acer negundo]